jgi:2-dehydro-3-deoxyglucarate aldolase/4-hydroxy-2-oxoheptanedioate aldolase
MVTRFKELLASDRIVRVFSMGRFVHPVVIDMFALAGGFDGFWLDQEHGGLTYDQICLGAVCGRANDFDCFVRMAPISYAMVTQAFEAGAGGVMAARIESAAQAEEFVRWAKFWPRGNRGMNSGGRDACFTYKPQKEFAAEANKNHLVSIQIEMLGAVKEVDQIAAIDGVDLLFIGPSDLSQALGHLGEVAHEKVWEAAALVAAACRKHGKHWGILPPDDAYATRALEMGARFLILGGDVQCLRRGIESFQREFPKQFAKT